MKKKQKLIQEAYGTRYNQLKPFIDENGWYKWSDDCPINLVISGFDYDESTNSHRPKSLREIEFNKQKKCLKQERTLSYKCNIIQFNMNIDTSKLVEILKKDQPISIMMVEENGNDKLVCLFALPHLAEKIEEFGKSILNKED